MKKNKFLVTLTISFLLVGLSELASIAQIPNAYFLGAKVALADSDCGGYYEQVAEPTQEQQAVVDSYDWVDNYVPTPEQQAALEEQIVPLEGGNLEAQQPSYSVPNENPGGSAYTTQPSGAGYAVGTKDGEYVYQNGTTGELYTVNGNGYQQIMDPNTSFTQLTPDQANKLAADSSSGGAVGGAGFAVGTKDGQAVFQNGTTGELYTVGSDGYKQTLDQSTTFTPLTQDQAEKLAAGSGITAAGLTTPSGQQLMRDSSGQLMQIGANGQMVPYTGSTIMGTTGTAGSGLFGALGQMVGSAVSGVGSLIGGALGLGGGTGGYGTTGGYGGIGGTSGYGTTGGYYGGTGGYSSLGGGTMMGGTVGGAGGWNPANYASTGLPSSSIYGIVRNIVMWALSLFGFFGIIGFVISGIWYLLASGDDALMKRAKNGMLYSIIGVVVGLIGLVIIYAANSLLNGSWFF